MPAPPKFLRRGDHAAQGRLEIGLLDKARRTARCLGRVSREDFAQDAWIFGRDGVIDLAIIADDDVGQVARPIGVSAVVAVDRVTRVAAEDNVGASVARNRVRTAFCPFNRPQAVHE